MPNRKLSKAEKAKRKKMIAERAKKARKARMIKKKLEAVENKIRKEEVLINTLDNIPGKKRLGNKLKKIARKRIEDLNKNRNKFRKKLGLKKTKKKVLKVPKKMTDEEVKDKIALENHLRKLKNEKEAKKKLEELRKLEKIRDNYENEIGNQMDNLESTIVTDLRNEIRDDKRIDVNGRLIINIPRDTANTIAVVKLVNETLTNANEMFGVNRRFYFTITYESELVDGSKVTRTMSIPFPQDDMDEAMEYLRQKIVSDYSNRLSNITNILQVKVAPQGINIINDIGYLDELLAYGSISDRKYQQRCLMSLSVKTKKCIYWTYLVINKKITPTRGKRAENHDRYVGKKLSYEEPFIRKYVKNGQLHRFLLYKSKERDYYLYTENSKKFHKYAVNGDVEILEDDEVDDNEIVFYHKGRHVAPALAMKLKKKNKVRKGNGSINVLDPIKNTTNQREKNEILHFYDIESYNGGKFGILCSVSQEKEGKFKGRHFASQVDFANYVDRMSVKSDKKTKPTGKIDYHNFYAHNATKYDSIYIYQALGKICPLSNISTSGNGIKSFRYGDNIMFKDSLLLIEGSLQTLTRDVFKLKVKASELPINYYGYPGDKYIEGKEVYPYKFYTEENKNYIGEVPGPEYFNDTESWERCCAEHKEYEKEFNLEQYTLYYCYLDCIFGYKMLKKFEEVNKHEAEIKCSPKEFNDVKKAMELKDYDKLEKLFPGATKNAAKLRHDYLEWARKRISHNPLNSITKSGETMTRFKKLYNVYDFVGIPDKYEKLVNISYKGGVTDVYKKSFNHSKAEEIHKNYSMMNEDEFNKYMDDILRNQDLKDTLHKDDINSSYPSVMLGDVPIKFIGCKGIFGKYMKDGEELDIDMDSDLLKEDDHGIEYIPNDEKEIEQLNEDVWKILEYGGNIDNIIIDHYLYNVSYKYEDRKFIPNIYVHKDSKFQGVQSRGGEMVWGSILKQAFREHMLNRQKHHGCSPRFEEFGIHGYLRFEAKPAFNQYITYLYTERAKIKDLIYKSNDQEEIAILEIKSKSLKDRMNCLYGKFGQKIFNETIMCSYKEFTTMEENNPGSITEIKEIDENQCLVSINNSDEKREGAIGKLRFVASYITACARVNLFDMVYSAGTKNVYYVDTDSCFYSGDRIGKIDPSKLGWRDSEICENVEGDNIIMTGLMCNAPKFYGSQGYKKTKGIWKKMKDKLKSKGIGRGKLKYSDYVKLNRGDEKKVQVDCLNFVKKMMEGFVVPTKIKKDVKCVHSKREFIGNDSIMNTGDVSDDDTSQSD